MSRILQIAAACALTLAACGRCPECPPCPGAETDAGAEAARVGDAGIEWDTGDAGMDAVPPGGEPSEVTEYELHGRAGFDRVSIWSEPDMSSPRLGYFRKGTRTRLGDPRYSCEDCPKGWYELPEGGFVCQGRGMLVGTRPRFMRRPPPPPRTDELSPYRYGFIRHDWTPVYRRLPSLEDMWSPPEREAEENGELGGEADTDADAGPAEAEIIPHSSTGEEGAVDYHAYTRRNFKSVAALLSRGFWVAVSERIRDDDTQQFYYETIAGNFVPANSVHLVRAPTFRGYEVLGDSPLPAAIVTSRQASFFERRGGTFRGAGPVDRLTAHRVFEVSDGKARGGPYYRVEGDRWLRASQVEFFDLRPPPEGVEEHEKWIRIDLSRQTLEAYEGSAPVLVTLVSTGLADPPEKQTPTGRFRVQFKHLTDDMTGNAGDEDAYSLEDVPWVQYYHRNYALHAAFWHSHYGRPRSNGCINLAPADARLLFEWSDPPLPRGWHGVAAREGMPATLVIVEGQTPQ